MKIDFMKDCKMIIISKICELNPISKIDSDLFYYIDLGSIDKGKWTEKKIISKSKAPSRAQRVLEYNDIIFQSVRPYNMGHYILKNQSDLPVVASTGFIQLRVNNADADYIYQLLYESRFNYNINLRCTGSNYPAINTDSFSEISIPLPSLEIQQKIAEILSTQDKVIELKQKLVDQKKQQKKWLMQNLLTGKIRLKGFEGEWEKVKLGDICEFLDNLRKPVKENERISGCYPYYGASGIIDYVDNYIFDGEYILLGEDGANIIMRSTPLAFKVKGKIWVNNHAHVLQVKLGYNIDFIVNLLESINYDKYNSGTAQPKLNREVCENLILIVSTIEEQTAIAKILSTQDREIELLEKELEQEKLKKKALMQLLLTVK